MTVHTRFPSPYDLKAPAGAEGWEQLYPYYLRFLDKLKDKEEAKFWFCDSQHWPSPFKPFDAVTVEFAVKCLGQYNTRHYLVPPANGVDYRIHNGYVYMSPVAVAPDLIPGRIPQFLQRAGHYFQNWDSLLANWQKKVRANIADLEALNFEKLPEVVPLEWITGGVGLDNTYALMETYDRAIQLLYKAWQYHFEFLNLGYAAYLDFFGFVKEQFPTIPDQAIAKMVQGVDVDLFQPDEELKKLAKLAVKLGLVNALKTGTVEQALEAVGKHPNGAEWLKAWKEAQDPWFNFTSGNGFYSTDKYWIEHLDIPLGFIRDYIARLEKGATIDRPTAEIAKERDRITSEYADMLKGDVRAAFEGKLGLARTVFPYVENHNFYIEHWSMSVFWRKMRELSRILHAAGFWNEPDDIFYLSRQEVRDALFDYSNAWAIGADADRPRLLAAGDREAPQDPCCARDAAATAGAQRTARRHHRAIHHHAVGHHHRERGALAQRCGGQAHIDRHGGVARKSRGPRPRHPLGRRARPDRRRRNPSRAGDGAELGAGVRQNPCNGHRHWWHDVACSDRVPGIWSACGHRHRQRQLLDQDRTDAPR